jgi:hypothetical protein
LPRLIVRAANSSAIAPSASFANQPATAEVGVTLALLNVNGELLVTDGRRSPSVCGAGTLCAARVCAHCRLGPAGSLRVAPYSRADEPNDGHWPGRRR